MQAQRQHGTEQAQETALAPHCVERFLQAGTEEAFDPLCRLLSPQLMRYFLVRGCENAAAEELTQDVLFIVFRQAATVRDRALFRGWVFKIAKNALLQRWRKASRTVAFLALDGMGPHPPEAIVMPATPDSDFGGLIAGLVPEDREILTLRYVDGLDYREISAALGIPVGTAKWRVFNSKLKLSVQLRKGAR